MHPTLTIALKAARRAGSIINQSSLRLDRLMIEEKSARDFVTETDRAAEAAIIAVLREAFPEHSILSEESGLSEGTEAQYQWIIDPLDGTLNFIHGLPQYAISIALAKDGVVEHALVFDPARNELFHASRGGGAFLNDRRIRVSSRIKMQEALVATDFTFQQAHRIEQYIAVFRELSAQTAGQRRPGAAALDLCWTACGRLDAYWAFGLKPWDVAAGSLLVQEAGGLVSDFDGEAQFLQGGELVCGTPKIFAPLLAIVRRHLAPAGSAA